ncbi:hypothetical protein BASA83_002345 [Batrachochytrium salamandrivorans]|nr:hypothetical protein BASA83_002345 [Batrachochytrium salamandrivorans]
MQRQLAEKTKRDQKHYEDAFGTYNDMMSRGEELEDELFEADLELRNSRDKSQKDDLTSNRNMARAMHESQQEACHLQYKTMMNSKKKLYEKRYVRTNKRYSQSNLPLYPSVPKTKNLSVDETVDMAASNQPFHS